MTKASVHFVISMNRPASHMFNVTMTVQEPNTEEQLFSLPAWIPGSYLLREFAKSLGPISARLEAGPIEVHKVDRNTWAVRGAKGPLTLQYDVYAWDMSVRSAHLDQTHGYYNGTSVCLMTHGMENESHSVEIIEPSDEKCVNWRVATTLKRVTGEEWGFGLFESPDYDDLVDHPVEMGDFTLATFEAAGVPHHIAITGRHSTDCERLCADLKEICETHINMFGELPKMDCYLFQVMAVGNAYGGLEHRSSTSLVCKRDDLPQKGVEEVTEGYRQFLGLCSHEYFHTWNVKRIKPAMFLPYDLSKESHTTLLWAFEGITSYFDDLGLIRSGMVDTESYLELLGRGATRVYRSYGRHKQSLFDSSFDAWTKFYRQDENAPNAIVSYYTKGAIVALALDMKIRHVTQDEKSLDDVMRVLWARHGKPLVGVPEDGVEKIVQEVAGEDFTDFFDSALRGTDDIELNPLLEPLGVRFCVRPQENSADKGGKPSKKKVTEQGCIGARTGAGGFGAKVLNVFDGAAAEDAGLAAGDVVVALDGLRVTGTDLEDRVAALKVGEEVSVHAFRRDELVTTTLKVGSPVADTVYFELIEDASEAVVARRNAWLGLGASEGLNA
ncbi:MAG: M61 family metallopeptidase [Deltaproteobacteria bacterium]|jgi:predicted metalloprotease with PDZ domain|nr:M61 family metallopeptidase [Deltaproteobacteria bacterium]